MKTDNFYYVSLLDSLANLLKLEDFQVEVLNTHGNDSDDLLNDFCDGLLFKSHPNFTSEPHALQVVAFYDELEVVNPIGSYTKSLGACFTSWQTLGQNIGPLSKQYSFLLLENMKIS